MRGRIPDSFIDELLTRVDIVDVIERRVPLKKAGREWTACCPFHNERSPSFYVSPQKQFFHCFGCGAHGSAIKFIMDYDRLEFPDAIEELAQSAGMKVPYEGTRDDKPREDRSDLYSLLDDAASFYQRELGNSAEARAYIDRRGLDDEIVKRFRIGWAPAGFDGVMKALGTTDRRRQLLNEAGMVASNERGSRYDRFRERVMFPILDRRGRVIAFGGRVLSSEQSPKYLNSPETPLFHKGRELFALWQVKQAHQHLTRIMVVEGYMDVIALHQAGLPIAVATLGTATTPEHAEVLFRAAPDVYFCFDGDRAGRQAAWRALESILPRMRDGRQAHFLFLPDGEDPDTLVRKEGKEGFEQRMKDAMPMSEYFFEELGRDVDTKRLDGKARLAERARPLISKLPDGAFRDLMAQELERRTGAQAKLEAQPDSGDRPKAANVQRSLVRAAITMLLSQPSLALEIDEPHGFRRYEAKGVDLLQELIDLARSRPDINPAILLESFTDRPEYPALMKLVEAGLLNDFEAQRKEFLDALAQMERQAVSQRREYLIARSHEGVLDDTEKAELRVLLAARAAPAPADGE
ncbi:DNA primase [Luteibacter sp. NPDC031894]|uniref:DNA primase n=1 Tax=Luteibacter sp. NPDC031894 TaxID=3390572 RepID=UPI003D048E97